MKSAKFNLGVMVVATMLLAAAQAAAVGTRQFVLDEEADFEGGDLEGVAIDSSGKVRAGFNLAPVPVEKGAALWCALRRPDGSVLLGTGNEGAILRLQGSQVTPFADTEAIAVTSIVEAWGRVFVATMPGSAVLELRGKALESFVELEDSEHIWQLAFDAKRGVLFAATGPQGKLWRVTQDGKAELYYDAKEQHLLSLAVGGDGSVYAGASDEARLYHVRGPGRATVLYDFGATEVRSIAVAANGDVYAIANEISSGSLTKKAASPATSTTNGAKKSTKTTGKGVLYRFSKDGSPTELLSNTSEHYVSLALDKDGRPYVGTGQEGKLFTVDDAHNSVLVADVEQRQVSVLLLGEAKRYLAVSDPIALYSVEGRGGTSAVWTSKVLDAGLRARFGRLRWTSAGQLELSTRSGNTKDPDETWSDWSEPMLTPAGVKSPPGRYVQVRARWNHDENAVLHELTLPFLTDNLRAVVTKVDVGRSSARGGSGITSSGGPITEKPNSDIRLSWKVDNPDADKLRFRLDYQVLGDPGWYPLLKPYEILTDDDYKWDTSTFPEGWYRVRVRASDELSNPPSRVTSHTLESGLILVDNTPPIVRNLEVQGMQIKGVAVDGAGPIQRIEVALAGSDQWFPFEPSDGIFDESTEEFVVDLTFMALSTPSILALRVFDDANNSVVRHVSLRP